MGYAAAHEEKLSPACLRHLATYCTITSCADLRAVFDRGCGRHVLLLLLPEPVELPRALQSTSSCFNSRFYHSRLGFQEALTGTMENAIEAPNGT
jgi:hypothetical protein